MWDRVSGGVHEQMRCKAGSPIRPKWRQEAEPQKLSLVEKGGLVFRVPTLDEK